MHTIIVPYRDRLEALKGFLDNICLPDRTSVYLIDVGSRQDTKDALEFRHRNLNYLHCLLPYSGTFWKTKALNYVLKQHPSEIVTVVDVDSVCPGKFFRPTEWYRMQLKLHRKIVYPVKLTDALDAPMMFEGRLTGCSHFTMLYQDLINAGGYHEGFKGWGWEDHELNMRLHNMYGDPLVYDRTMYHQPHTYSDSWRTQEDEIRNRELYQACKAAGFPKPENEAFGDFTGLMDAQLEAEYLQRIDDLQEYISKDLTYLRQTFVA